MRRFIRILCLCLILCMTLPMLASCSQGNVMMKIGDKTLSVNTYEFLLSRMKGTLGYYGYDVDDQRFWNTVVTMDGMTWDDYFSAQIMREASHYVIADYLFDEYGLSLSDDDMENVDKLLKAYVDKAGSKTALNADLKKYGVNYEMLRQIYVLEAKIIKLKEHLYGKDGENISVDEKDDYFEKNYVSFKQIFLATYYYVTDVDRFGDVVYYTDDKHTEIAYDKVNGTTKTDEFGKQIKDILGNVEYFTEDGKIAYDRERGVIGYVTDDNGDKTIAKYSDDKKAEVYDKAQKYAVDCDGSVQKFEEYIEMYGENDASQRIYLYSSAGYYAAQNDAVAYFDDIAQELSDMEIGECRVYESDYGCHVIFKYKNEDGAYSLEENKDAFTDFESNLIAYLYGDLCAGYEKDVEVDYQVADSARSLIEIGENTLY